MEIALLGGSFNPPHVGHLLAALYVRAALGADQVWLLPSFHHPFGKQLVAFEHRLEMCRALVADVGPWAQVKDTEAQVGGEGRTVDLLEHLVAEHPNDRFWLVLGSDILKDLPYWKAWDRIEQLARVVVLNRAGFPDPRALGPPLALVSSTELRARLSSGEASEHLLTRGVSAYVASRGLYRTA